MPSIIALISKSEFEKAHAGARVGSHLPLSVYKSSSAGLAPLGGGGDLFLVTVRPGDVLWLVAILRSPAFKGDRWEAAPSEVRVADVTGIAGELRFTSGKGVSREPGKLGMSLQTPRALTDDDVRLLTGLGGASEGSGAEKLAVVVERAPATRPRPKARNQVPEAPPTSPAGFPVGTPWAKSPPRPATVPDDAAYDAIDRRWVAGHRSPDGVRTGAWREWRSDGSLYLDTNYVGGLIHGTQREFHPDGSPAAVAHWVDGVQREVSLHRVKQGLTDFTHFEGIDASVVTFVSLAADEGDGWRSGTCFDAAGAERNPDGSLTPPRPATVPPTARYTVASTETTPVPARWVDGATQYTIQTPIGLQRTWSESGTLLRTVERTRRGRKIWIHEAMTPDPRDAAIDEFFAAPEDFSAAYRLGATWTPEVHERVRTRLKSSSTVHVAEYLELLEERVEWHLAELARPRGLNALGLDVFDDWLARMGGALVDLPRDPSAAKVFHGALPWLLDRHARARVAELLPAARRHLDPKSAPDAELLARAKALATGELDRELDALGAPNAKGRTADELLALARRALGVPQLSIFLGSPGKGEVLLRSEATGRAYVFDRTSFAEAPLAVDDSQRSHALHFAPYDTCDERRLFLSGEHVWWSQLRYGFSVYLQGTQYYSSRGQAEITLAAFVRCPDLAWVRRVQAMFRASMPSGAVEVDPFFLASKGWLLAWAYEAGPVDPFGQSPSRGIDGDAVLSAGRSPGVLRLEMKRDGTRGPTVLERHESHEEAVERFARFETTLFRHGYELERIVALPLPHRADPAPSEKTSKKPVVAAAPVLAGLAPDVTALLERAAEAPEPRTKLEALREAWEARPAPALANALDALSAREPKRSDLAGKTRNAIAVWDATEKTRDPRALGSLLASLADVPSAVVQSRLEQLCTWPEDPRLDQALLAIAWEIPFTSSGTQSLWRRIFRRLALSRDGRIAQRLSELPARYESEWQTVTGAWAAEQVEGIGAARLPTLKTLAALTLLPAEQAALDRIVGAAAPAADGRGELIAKILAEPDAVELRRQYAETFGPMGDLRAEHIALSLRGDSLDKVARARLKTLETEHAAELAGPLAKHLKKGIKFRAGFVSECARSGANLEEEIAESPWWATVERLDANYDDALLRSKALVSLRELSGASFETSDRPGWGVDLSGVPVRPRLRALRVSVHSALGIRELLRSGKFPALDRLALEVFSSSRIDPTEWLTDSLALERVTWVQEAGSTTTFLPVGGGTRQEHDRTSIESLAALWAVARRHPTLTVVAAEVTYAAPPHTLFEIVRDGPGEPVLTVRAGARYGWRTVLRDNVVALIDLLAPLGCRRIVLEKKIQDREAFLQPIAEAARLAGMVLDETKLVEG